MALNNEDKKDVQKHMGKALANKVSKVTKDKHSYAADFSDLRRERDIKRSAKQQAVLREKRKSNNLPTSGSAPSIY